MASPPTLRSQVRAPRLQPLARTVIEPAETLEDRIPLWVLGGLAMLLAVQLAIAL
ncbi:MAG: hypothetical protein R3A79_02775 [Nannocystaceae bacterium]